jgi:hypothetical protein
MYALRRLSTMQREIFGRRSVGPLQFMVIGFEGNRFNGEIMPQLDLLRKRQVVRVLDLVLVSRDREGTVSSLEMSDLESEGAVTETLIEDEQGPWFAEDDIDWIGDTLPKQSAVAMVLLEHLWAKPLQEATQRAKGSVLVEGLVPSELAAEVERLLGPQDA